MKAIAKIGLFALMVTIFLGTKYWNKSTTAKDTKQQMLNICDVDNDCQKAVETYFEKCFENHYSLGNRRRAGSLDHVKFADCVNEGAGAAYFEAQ